VVPLSLGAVEAPAPSPWGKGVVCFAQKRKEPLKKNPPTTKRRSRNFSGKQGSKNI